MSNPFKSLKTRVMFNNMRDLIIHKREEIPDDELEDIPPDEVLCEFINSLDREEIKKLIFIITIFAVGWKNHEN